MVEAREEKSGTPWSAFQTMLRVAIKDFLRDLKCKRISLSQSKDGLEGGGPRWKGS
jgi:hypothetical protein